MYHRKTALTLITSLLLFVPTLSSAGDRHYPSRCKDQSVLNRIAGKFAWAERTQWHRGYVIEQIVSPRLRYQVNYGPTRIRHDHCQARAVMTNGRVRRVYYTVEREQGFASIGDNVKYCIIGLDPWHVYGAACSTVR